MGNLTMTKQIEAAPEAVFEVFADLDKFADRVSGIVRIERLTDGAVGVGTRFRETRMMFKREATEEMEFTAFEAGRSYTLGCESCGCDYATTFTFRPEGNGTLVEVDMQFRPITFFAKLMMPLGKLMSGPLKKCIDRDVEDLKAVVESAPELTPGP